MKAVFLPFSIVAGILAGQVAKRLFTLIWGVVGDEDAPEPKHRDIVLSQLVVALILEGAITKLVKGLADHGSRHAFVRATGGDWPGEERPDPST